jgi:hypothetical protein
MLGLVTIELITVGLDFANKVLGLCQQKDSLQDEHLINLIYDSTESLKNVIQMSANQVIHKIEQDKMEELISRLKNIDLLLRMKNRDNLLNYLLLVQESVDYAQNRVNEGKFQWATVYLVGKSMIYAAFTYLGNESPQIEQELLRGLEEAKFKILDEISAVFIQSGRAIPWQSIKNVLDNKTNSLNDLIKLLPEKKTEITNSDQGKTVVLNPVKNPVNFVEKLNEICIKYEEIDSCYFSDTIPIKKLKNACQSFDIPENEKVIFLCDSTVFRSGKVGFAICENGLYWGVDWTTSTKRTKLTWEEFSKRNVELSEKRVHLDRGDYIDLVTVNKRKEVVALLNEIKNYVKQIDFDR